MVSTEPLAASPDPSPGRDPEIGVEIVEDSLVALLRHMSSARTWRRIAAGTGTDLDKARYHVLRAVAENAPVRTTELAELLGVDPSTMSRHVSVLERAQLVERVPDPVDRRASSVSITESGKRVMSRVRDARHEIISAVLEDWSPSDRAQLAPLLARLANDFSRVDRP